MRTILVLAVTALSLSGAWAGTAPQGTENDGPAGVKPLEGRQRFWFDRHRDASGKVPADGRSRALAQMERAIRSGLLKVAGGGGTTDAIEGGNWLPIGPRPIDDFGYAYAGRITALAVHPTSPGTVYAGAAQGGVWKTTDAGATWTALTDGQDSLATGAITLDPSNPNVVYVGTGEANQACDAYFGIGILKSTDAGATWAKIGGTTFQDTSIAKIVVHPTTSTTLWVATGSGAAGFACYGKYPSTGVFKSTNGGANWTQVLGSAQTGFNSGVHDLVIAPGSPDTLYAAANQSGVWKSVNGGTFWAKLGGGLPTTDVGRIDLAIDPSNANVLYAVVEAYSTGTQLGTWKSTNAGGTWSPLPKPSGSCHYWNFQDLCTWTGSTYGQCWYDLALEVQSGGTVWMGGVAFFNSTTAGASWTDVCPESLHVDHHAIAFGSDGRVWVGNDGGVWSTADGGATWDNRNANLQIAQFYPGASIDPSNYNRAIGGTQDNGTAEFNGGTTWPTLTGGDGASTAIDRSSPASTWYTSYQYLNILKTSDGGVTYTDAVNGLTDANTDAAYFISPFVMCPGDSNVLIAGSNNVWRTNDGAGLWATNSPDPIAGGSKVLALAFAGSGTSAPCDTYAAGMGNGQVFRTVDAGATWGNVTGPFGGRAVNDVAYDPANRDVLYVALSGFGGPHLYKTTNLSAATPSWSAIDAGIPDMPINAVLVDPETSTVVYAGSDLGLFKSVDGGATWALQLNGIPKLAIYDLVADATTRALVAFTHGRGAFRLNVPCTAPEFQGVDSVVETGACGPGLVVNWSAPSPWGQTATSGTFEVQRFLAEDCSDAPTTLAANLPASQRSFTDPSPPTGVWVRYRVVARNNCSPPLASSGANACAPALDGVDGAACAPVAATLQLGKNAGDAVLDWEAVACNDLAEYRVYAAESFSAPFPSAWTLLTTTGGTGAVDTLGSAWSAYRIVTVDACGNASD
jgi:hypothetical protein